MPPALTPALLSAAWTPFSTAAAAATTTATMDPMVDVLWALFRRIDKSRDGKVSVKELNAARKRGDLDISAAEAKALMRFSDEDDNGNKELSFAAFYVATTDKQLDPRITPSLLQLFTKLDANNDGYVTKKDLEKASENGLFLTKKERDFLLKAADADGDKRVSLSEYVNVFADTIKVVLSPEEEQQLRAQFALLDDNGDGYISKSELRKQCKSTGLTNKHVVATLQAADLDGDGTISFEEFVQLMQK